MRFLGEVEVTGSVADGIAPVPTGEQAPHGVNVNVLDEVHAKHCLIVSSGQSSPNTHRHQTVTIEQTFGRSRSQKPAAAAAGPESPAAEAKKDDSAE